MAEKRRPSVHSSFPFFSHTAALVLSLLTFTARLCPAVAANMCDDIELVHRKGKVIIACHLTSDVYITKHSFLIKYFNQRASVEYVLACDWLASLKRFHCLQSRVGAELIGIRPDRVLARLPKETMGNGTYRTQLVPPNRNRPFVDCNICDPGADTRHVELVTTVAVLTIVGIWLLMLLFLRYRRRVPLKKALDPRYWIR